MAHRSLTVRQPAWVELTKSMQRDSGVLLSVFRWTSLALYLQAWIKRASYLYMYICIYDTWLWNNGLCKEIKTATQPSRILSEHCPWRTPEACFGDRHCPEHFWNQLELICSRHQEFSSWYFCTTLIWTPIKILASLFPLISNTLKHTYSSKGGWGGWL